MPPSRRLLAAAVTAAAVAAAAIVYVLARGSAAPHAIRFAPRSVERVSFVVNRGETCPRSSWATTVAACPFSARKLSWDPLTDADAQHEGSADAAVARFGNSIVVVYQVDRARTGGPSALIGFATSHDAGRTWTSGFVPRLTLRSRPRGRYRFATDPSVAYDRQHHRWLIVSYVLDASAFPFSAMLVSGSEDGTHWESPRPLLSRSERISFDKPWIQCDDSVASPHVGTCYAAYNEQGDGVALQRSQDGGKTWSRPVVVGATDLVGALPLVAADGAVEFVFRRDQRIYAVRSTDAGRTFARATAIGRQTLTAVEDTGVYPYPFRAAGVPSVAEADGVMYVAWADCESRACRSGDIWLTSSRDGVHWRRPAEVVAEPAGSYALLPALAATARRVALAFYVLRRAQRTVAPTLALSGDGGVTWATTKPLAPAPFSLDWLIKAGPYHYVGDYIGVTIVGRRVVAAATIARRPNGRHFRQATYALSSTR